MHQKIGWLDKCENGRSAGGIWSKNESENHVNAVELLAVKVSFMPLLHERHNTHEMGSCKSHQCNEIALEHWIWARVKNKWQHTFQGASM